MKDPNCIKHNDSSTLASDRESQKKKHVQKFKMRTISNGR